MNNDIKNTIMQLISEKKISQEIIDVINNVSQVLVDSVLSDSGEEIAQPKNFTKNFIRREENLRRQNIMCYGLKESLEALKLIKIL